MLLTSSIILGFIRLCFLLLFLFYLNRKLVNQSESNNFLEFLVHQWFKYGSIIGIVIFVTVQLSIYDLLNCMIILLTIILIDYIGVKNLRNIREYLNVSTKKNIHKLLKHIELKRPAISWIAFRKSGNGLFAILLIVILAIITFGSRFYFFKYDLYSLSNGWIGDLEKVIDFDSQIWFLKETAVAGDLIFVNFYSKIADVSPEIALQSMGLLESTLLSILLFWVIRKITPSKSLAPIIAAMSFALAYTLTPVNIYFLLQNKPIFLGLAFGLPTMVFLLRPGLLKFKKLNYFFSMLFVFITIGLVDLFTLLILFPPFLFFAAMFTRRKSRKYFWIGALGYLLAVAVIIALYGIICIYFESDLGIFLHSNLLSVSSYTYIPQLLISFGTLQDYYQISTFGGIALLLFFILYKKENWGAAFAFLLYFNFLILLGHIKSTWIDDDLLNQALSVFMPIVAGINAAIVINLFKPLLTKVEWMNKFAVVALISGIIFCAVYYQRDTIEELTEADTTPKQVLDAYDRISNTYFPYSYAVVNENAAQVISLNKHFFMNYSDFLYDYPTQDSIYFKNAHNPKFFKKNPQYVLPKSVLLFVFKDANPEMYGESGDISDVLMDQLQMLKKRGRKVNLFYDNKNLKVYEIINVADESKISDLIF